MHTKEAIRAAAEEAAAELARLPQPVRHVAFVACSYDAFFEPLELQIGTKLEQLSKDFGLEGPVHWSLWVVDDLPPAAGFTEAAQKAFAAAPENVLAANRLHVLRMNSCQPRHGGLKGQALLDGMHAAMKAIDKLSAIVYINLNLKVDALYAAPGLVQVLTGKSDAAIGSRSEKDGGLAIGRGLAGTVKSRAFNLLSRMLLPPLRGYYDTNAPVKIFSPPAARLLVEHARIPTVTMDCEWLLLLHRADMKVSLFPIVWAQRSGSRPPWHLSRSCLADVLAIRRRLISKTTLQ